MNKFQILVVEDDSLTRSLIVTALKTHEYRLITAEKGEEAVMEAASYCPDAILLDLGLPDIDGVEVIRQIRGWSHVPIIVLSGRSEDDDKIETLDAGADDYLTKPFSVEELLARLRVVQRRAAFLKSESAAQSIYENGSLKLDCVSGCAYLGEEELHLTPIEYKLLCLLMQNTGKVLTHKFILQNIWGSSLESEMGSLRVFMAMLRKKLAGAPGAPQYIKTHIGIGYRMLKVE